MATAITVSELQNIYAEKTNACVIAVRRKAVSPPGQG